MLLMQITKKKIFIIAGTIASITIVLTLATSTLSHQNIPKPDVQSGTYKDPISGEYLPVEKGKDRQYDLNTPNTPTFGGFSQLIPLGVTLTQVTTIEYAFSKYPLFTHTSPYISLAVNDLNPFTPDPNDPLGKIRIDSHVVVSGKITYKISMYFWGLGNVELLINDASGKIQLFDSGAVANTDIPTSP